MNLYVHNLYLVSTPHSFLFSIRDKHGQAYAPENAWSMTSDPGQSFGQRGAKGRHGQAGGRSLETFCVRMWTHQIKDLPLACVVSDRTLADDWASVDKGKLRGERVSCTSPSEVWGGERPQSSLECALPVCDAKHEDC